MVKKHILVIRNAYAYDFGGAERFAVFLTKVLSDAPGYEATVISRNPGLLAFARHQNVSAIRGWWWEQQNWSGVRSLLFPIYVLWQLLLTVWYAWTYKREQPSVVHIQSRDDFIAATLAAKLLGIQIIWTDHADLKHVWKNLFTPLKNPVGKFVHFCARYTTAITVVSQSEQRLVLANLASSSVKKKLLVVHNGCSDVAENYTEKKYHEFTFCVFGRLVKDKGIGDVITAFLQLESASAKLRIVGDGPDAPLFKKLAASSRNISFVGHSHDPLAVVSRAHVVVHPSHHEGFSIALVEASMLGMPIIATAVGGNVEIIHNEKTGLLVPPSSPPDLTTAMELLMRSSELRNKLGAGARQNYLDNYIFEHIVENKFMEIYEKSRN